MAVIQSRRVDSDTGEGNYERKQLVRLPNGLYGGMFAWYSLPKTRTKFQSEETEEVFYCGFVITHDRTNTQLPHKSEAILTVRPKRFYNEITGMKSGEVSLLYALHGGKLSYQEVCDLPDQDFDELIGRPAILFVEQNTKADKNGLFGHRVKGIEPPDAGLRKAMTPLWKARKVGMSHDLARLESPAPEYQDDLSKDEVVDAMYAAEAARGIDDTDDIPF